MDMAPSSRQFRALLCRGMDGDERRRAVSSSPYIAQRSRLPHLTTGPTPPPTGIPDPSFTVVRPDRHGATTRMWLLAVGPTIAAPGFVARAWRLDDQGRWYWRKRAGPCLCGTQRPEHGRAHGRQAFLFCRPQVGTNPVGCGQLHAHDGEFDKTGSLIHRDGTLNGIATANERACTLPVVTSLRTDASRLIRRRALRAAVPASVRTSRCPATRSYALGRHTCRRQQERRRVSPDRHQRRGTATGATDCQIGERIAVPGANRRSDNSRGN